MNKNKESFVRTVLTARQKCHEFNNLIRQKDESLQAGRNVAQGLDMHEHKTTTFNRGYQSSSEEQHEGTTAMVMTTKSTNVQNQRYGPQTHAQIRQINRKSQDGPQHHVTGQAKSNQHSRKPSNQTIPVCRTPAQEIQVTNSTVEMDPY